MMKDDPSFARRKFLYRLSRTQYEKDWGNKYYKPGFGARLLAFLIQIMPRIGSFKAVGFKVPTPQAEDLYFKSVNATVDRYGHYLDEMGNGTISLENRDFDTGEITHAGEYRLTDETYGKLTAQLAQKNFGDLTPGLKDNIVEFYGTAAPQQVNVKDRANVEEVLAKLKQAQPRMEEPTLPAQPAAPPKKPEAPAHSDAPNGMILGTNLAN